MNKLKHVTIGGRPAFTTHVGDFKSLSDILFPSDHFVLLLVSDATGVDSETIYEQAANLIERGAIYVCTWGPDCERVHDIFDEADVGDGTNVGDILMTTWHTDDTLKEAMDFFFSCAFPLDNKFDSCSWIIISVGDSSLSSLVESTVIATRSWGDGGSSD